MEIILSLIVSLFGGFNATVESLQPCPWEDSVGTVCAWDASAHGNGKGDDFIVIGSMVFYE